MSFRVVVDSSEVISGLNNLLSKLKTPTASLEAGGRAGLEVAQSNAPVKTGYLKNQLYYEVKGNELELGGNADYTIYHEFGTSRGTPARRMITKGADVAVKKVNEMLGSELGLG